MGIFKPAENWSGSSAAQTPAPIAEAEGQISKNLLSEALPGELLSGGAVEPNANGEFLVLSTQGDTLQLADIPNSQNIKKIVLTSKEINWTDVKQTSYGAVQIGEAQGELHFDDGLPGPVRFCKIPVTLYVEPANQTVEYTSSTMEKLDEQKRDPKRGFSLASAA